MRFRNSDKGLNVFLDERENLVVIALSVVNSRAIAEELVHDAWLNWGKHDYPEDDARPIFRRIVKNLARDFWRRQKTEKNALDALGLVSDTAPSTERVVMARQDLARVVATLARMPKRTRKAFKMSWLDGRSCAEIGRRLGISKARAHQLVQRALVDVALSLEP